MLELNSEDTTRRQEAFIRSICKKEGYKKVIVAVSGGIDSATSLTLAVRALGKSNVYAVLLPYEPPISVSTKDAWLVINSLGIPRKNVYVVDIKPFVDKIVSYDKSMDNIRRGNIMARLRMIILYDLARKHNFLVVGTENKTEHLLGYYTRFGDEASDIEPLRGLYKTQVFKLAEYLGVPEKILTKHPTAGLWNGQTDEGEFGFSYKIADDMLFLYTEIELSKEKIISKGYNKKIVNKIWWWIDKGVFKERVPHSLPKN